MRARTWFAGAFLVVVGVFALGGIAGAQETSSASFKNDAAKECHEKLENGHSIDDCQKAPSPILPATNELIWGSISFVVLFGLLYKFAWPGLKKGLDQRTERIRTDLE